MENNNNNRKWVKAYTDSIKYLVKLNLTQREYKVILYLITLIQSNNILLSMSQRDIAKDLDIAQSNICNTLKSLEKKGIIIKQNGHLFLNSDIIQFQEFNINVCVPSWKNDNNIKKNTRDKRKEKSNDLYTEEEKELFAEKEL